MTAANNLCRIRRPSARFAIAVIFVASLAVAFTHSQQPSHESTSRLARKLYPIAGALTNSVTGEAIADGTITLLSTDHRNVLQTTQTDPAGHFALAPVPAAKYSLVASQRGYFTAALDAHENYSSAIVTGEGQDTEHIPFRLNPQSMIRGVVTDDASEPVANAKVYLSRRSKRGGLGEHLLRTMVGDTDDNGLFELWNLEPGSYLMAVQADPWFAIHPTLKDLQNAASSDVRQQMDSLDVAYPVTYYPGTTEESSAISIPIGIGDRIEANFSLHAVPAMHLTVHRPPTDAGKEVPHPRPQVTQEVFGIWTVPVNPISRGLRGEDFPNPEVSNTDDLEFSGVAPGHYSVSLGDPPRETEIDAAGNPVVDLSSAPHLFSVQVGIKMADGSAPPSPLDVTLIEDDVHRTSFTVGAEGHSAVQFNAIAPGRWMLITESKGHALGVVSMQSSTNNVIDGRIVVKDRDLSVAAVLSEGKTSVDGFATSNGKGEAGAMVVLVPSDPSLRFQLIRRDQSDSDGSFLLPAVAPGQYKVVAIRDGWDLDWARPEVLSKYLPAGTPLTISPDSPKSIRLTTPVVVQPR